MLVGSAGLGAGNVCLFGVLPRGVVPAYCLGLFLIPTERLYSVGIASSCGADRSFGGRLASRVRCSELSLVFPFEWM